MTLSRPMFPPRRTRADGDRAHALPAKEATVVAFPSVACGGSMFDLYPMPFFDGCRSERQAWAAEPSGNYLTDCETGRAYAVALVGSCDGSRGWCSLLGPIVRDMVLAGDTSGLVIGFMGAIGQALAVGRAS